MQESREEIVYEIKALVAEPGYMFSIFMLMFHDFFYAPDEVLEVNWRERILFSEAAYLLHFLIRNGFNDKITPSHEIVSSQITRTYDLLEELHLTYSASFIDSLPKNEEEHKKWIASPDLFKQHHLETFGSGDIAIESMFYGALGGFDFQFWELAPKKFSQDMEWIYKSKGISLEDLTLITRRLKELSEKKAQNFEGDPVSIFKFSRAELEAICGVSKASAFLKIFVLNPKELDEEFILPGQYNPLFAKPVIPFGEDTYLLPINYYLGESIFVRPFDWMLDDENYKDVAMVHRGNATTNIAYEMLNKVFKGNNIYKNVLIKDASGNTVTDIDILCILGNKALVLQCKSKRVKKASFLGDATSLDEDFSKAVQEPYEQGLKCKTAVLGKDYRFYDEFRNEIHLSQELNDAYLVCILSEDFPGLQNQIRARLATNPSQPYPVVMSLIDLDILSFYLTDPYRFAYYIKQRTSLFEDFVAGSETDFLAYHFKRKLFKIPGYNGIALDTSYSDYVLANFPVLKGYQPKTSATDKLFNTWKNEKFEKIIQQIIKTNDLGFTDAVFFLFDLEGSGADDTIKFIEDAKRRAHNKKGESSVAMVNYDEKFGYSYISKPQKSGNLLSKVLGYGQLAKYKHKADIWLSMGAYDNSENYIDAVAFSNQKWEQNNKMDMLTKELLGNGTFINVNKRIGRNDPCPCGSGRKYKRCCGSN